MKKLLAIATASALSVGVLAGCSSHERYEETSTTRTTTPTYQSGEGQEYQGSRADSEQVQQTTTYERTTYGKEDQSY